MYHQQNTVVRGGKGYSTEVAGRDRFKFFRRPVEGDGAAFADETAGERWPNTAQLHFAASCPPERALGGTLNSQTFSHSHGGMFSTGMQPRRPSTGDNALSGRRARPGARAAARNHHLPRLDASAESVGSGDELSAAARAGGAAVRDAGMQTAFRDNEAQTDPYTPDYVIPDGQSEPDILKLQGLTYQQGLPAGQEEVDLIQRIRRRRELQESLPQGSDAASIEARFARLHELEEQEWAEREEHMEKLQSRRLERIQESLLAREAAREEANRARLDRVREQQMASLKRTLETNESKRLGNTRRALDKKLASKGGLQPNAKVTTTRRDLLDAYVKYGVEARAPVIDEEAAQLEGTRTGTHGLHGAGAVSTQNYDVRPTLLTVSEGVDEIHKARGARIETVPTSAFDVPVNAAVAQLPSLYQRHEAQRTVDALEYMHAKLHGTDASARNHEETQRALDTYRATPKLQRPATPVLELDGDEEEEVEEACILLQRLLRGRAVQNDFFEGKERCRGLIAELQAASSVQLTARALADTKAREALSANHEEMARSVLETAEGDIISETLGFLYQELTRQQDAARLEALRKEAEEERQTREAEEVARREALSAQRDREEVCGAAHARATDATTQCFLQDVLQDAVSSTALEVAMESERQRQAALPAPRDPVEAVDKENTVCDMLDGFVIPAVVDAIRLHDRFLDKRAPAHAASEEAAEAARKADSGT